ncbi:MAG: MarR family transcriptional regulator [Oscillospiraceae bacterium]|nr:MarR family transcriptional regulator [Oscillospiraceae bacterium]
MDSFAARLNELLDETYLNIMTMEEQSVRSCNLDLSTSEFHLLQVVGRAGEKGITVSEIASFIHVARPTASVAINKLERKGFVTKERCSKDGRAIYVKLTRSGVLADKYHRYYHRQLFSQLTTEFTQEEKAALIRGVEKLNQIFLNTIAQRDR